jgi:hypothetical protein
MTTLGAFAEALPALAGPALFLFPRSSAERDGRVRSENSNASASNSRTADHLPDETRDDVQIAIWLDYSERSLKLRDIKTRLSEFVRAEIRCSANTSLTAAVSCSRSTNRSTTTDLRASLTRSLMACGTDHSPRRTEGTAQP